MKYLKLLIFIIIAILAASCGKGGNKVNDNDVSDADLNDETAEFEDDIYEEDDDSSDEIITEPDDEPDDGVDEDPDDDPDDDPDEDPNPYNLYQGDVTILKDSDKNKLKGYEGLTGSLVIGSRDNRSTHRDIIDLDGLENVIWIGEDLIIGNNRNLEDISGLDNIIHVGGDFEIFFNYVIDEMNGFNELTHIGGKLRIDVNNDYYATTGLRRILGFQKLQTVDGDLSITKNKRLPRCFATALEERIVLGGETVFYHNATGRCDFCRYEIHEGDIEITTEEDLELLKDVGTVKGSITVNYTDLETLNGMECLRTVEGDITINGNTELNDIKALHLIETVEGDFTVSDNPALPECQFDWLYKLNVEGTDTRENNNPQCDDPCGWKVWEGEARVDYENAESKLEAFSIYKKIDGSLAVWYAHLDNLTKIGCISEISGELRIASSRLTTLEGIENVRTIYGGLIVADNQYLYDISKIRHIENIYGHLLSVSLNKSLNNIDGLENIKNFEGEVSFYKNENLTDISALSNLRTIGGDLRILENDILTDLSGLYNLEKVEGDIQIINNPELSREEIHEFAKDVKTNGYRMVYNNKPKTTTPPVTTTDLLIVVQSSIYDQIEQKLLRYQNDILNDGYTSEIVKFSSKKPSDLRNILATKYQQKGIQGAFLVGDLPVAWYEQLRNEFVYIYEVFPSDIYYMDLDGYWRDIKDNGVYDYFSELDLEIFVSRLPGTVDEINFYFDKNHDYRTNGHLVEPRAFVFLDRYIEPDEEFVFLLDLIYDDIMRMQKYEETKASDFIDYLSNTGAEFVYIGLHGSPTAMLTSGTLIETNDIRNNPIKGSFFALDSCNVSRFTEKDNLGTAFLHTMYGLATIGSSKPFYFIGRSFVENLNEGAVWGDSFKDMYNFYTLSEFFDDNGLGKVLMGDPLLTVSGE